MGYIGEPDELEEIELEPLRNPGETVPVEPAYTPSVPTVVPEPVTEPAAPEREPEQVPA